MSATCHLRCATTLRPPRTTADCSICYTDVGALLPALAVNIPRINLALLLFVVTLDVLQGKPVDPLLQTSPTGQLVSKELCTSGYTMQNCSTRV
jgi:hypothetical protein